MRLDKADFTIFDFETTGLYPYSGDRICEVACVRGHPRKRPIKKFHSLVNPGRAISYQASAINGITDDMVMDAPAISKVLPEFLKFIDGSVLVAYNAGFDLGFLESAMGDKSDLLKDYHVIDALVLARRLFPDLGRYNLGSVAGALGIAHASEHRAMADAVMTWKVFKKELEVLKENGVLDIREIAYTRTPRKARPSLLKVSDYRIRLVKEAIREQKKLNIIYRSVWNDSVTERVITPKELKSGYDRSYVIAHCHLKDEERNFRIDGILEAKMI